MHDIKSAFRQLIKSPGFALVAVATLALGIGANTAIFSVINSALLRPLQFAQPERLVQFWSVPRDGEPFPHVSGPQLKQWREHATLFEGFAGFHDRFALNLISDGQAERVTGAEVTANYLDLLGVKPLLGHSFDPNADQVGYDARVVIISYEWWQNRFGGDPDLVGQRLNFGQHYHTVVGILPPRALTLDHVNFMIPLNLEDLPWRLAPDNPWVGVIARLKDDVTVAQAETEALNLSNELYDRLMPNSLQRRVQLEPMRELLVGESRPTLILLLGAVALVLLIACANVANLMLARATNRQKEMAVRAALGAGTGRIIRQVLTESLVLALLGCVVGIATAAFSVGLLTRLTAGVLPQMLEPSLDTRVLVFSVVLALATGVFFGIFPALQACRNNPNRDLKEGGRGSTSGSRTRMQSLLIVAEIALTVMLMIGAGLLLRSFSRILESDSGFTSDNALVCNLSLSNDTFESEEQLLEYQRELVRRLRALPGVEAAGTSTTLPLSLDTWGARVGPSEIPATEHVHGSLLDYVSGDYFRAMGIPLLAGRALQETDNSVDVPRVVVVNQAFVDLLYPDTDPLGRRVHFNEADWEIVGVVANARQFAMDENSTRHMYAVQARSPYNVCLIIRTRLDPRAMQEDIRRTVAALDPNQSVANFRTLQEAVDQSLQARRLTIGLLGIFAAVALGLSCLGIYGVIAYTIGQRHRELCIRMALGAQHQDVIGLVLRDGLKLGAIGVAVGLIGGLGGARLIASQLYEVSSVDPVVFVGVAVLLSLVTALSIYLPARRAANADPIVALRAE